MNKLYSDKPSDYFQLVRKEIIDLIPLKSKRFLDIGCGEGNTAYEAKKFLNADFVAGVELNEYACEIARNKLDYVICGNIETIELPFEDRYFDCIICADVLEHLVNPWSVLSMLKRYLKDDGVIIASIPNLQYIVPLLKILGNKFEYEDYGILDKSHLRFFTLHTIKKMFTECDYEIVKIDYNKNESLKVKLFNLITFGLFKKFTIFQYLIVAKPKRN